jgi:chemotaxis protein histidine kinase CheA
MGFIDFIRNLVAEAPKKAEDEATRKKAKDEAARKKAKDETARKKAKDETARKKAEDEAARKKVEDETARKKAEDEAARKKAEDEAARKKAEDEAGSTKPSSHPPEDPDDVASAAVRDALSRHRSQYATELHRVDLERMDHFIAWRRLESDLRNCQRENNELHQDLEWHGQLKLYTIVGVALAFVACGLRRWLNSHSQLGVVSRLPSCDFNTVLAKYEAAVPEGYRLPAIAFGVCGVRGSGKSLFTSLFYSVLRNEQLNSNKFASGLRSTDSTYRESESLSVGSSTSGTELCVLTKQQVARRQAQTTNDILSAVVLTISACDLTSPEGETARESIRAMRGQLESAALDSNGERPTGRHIRCVLLITQLDRYPTMARRKSRALWHGKRDRTIRSLAAAASSELGFTLSNIFCIGWLHEDISDCRNGSDPRIATVRAVIMRATQEAIDRCMQ